MYDNLDLKIRGNEVKNIDFLSVTPQYFNVKSEHLFSDELVLSGYLNNLKITVSKKGVKISEGSLCKWFLGNNFQTLTRGDTQRAIEKLSDTLHLPVNLSDVTKIDLAQNMIVKYRPEVYFNHLGNLNHYIRHLDGSLYYNNTNKQLIFYDKIKEQISKGQNIPELYNNRFALRYEMRFRHRLRELFNTSEVKASLLYNEAFYIEILNKWQREYKAINKINEFNLDFKQMNNLKELKTAGLLALIELSGGELAMLEMIKEAQSKEELSKSMAFDFREAIKTACKSKLLTVQNDLITELDQKINEAVKYYR